MKAAVWYRVSTGHQDSSNQIPDVEAYCARQGWEISRRFDIAESAWNGGKDGGEYRRTIEAVLLGALRGEYDVLVLWALDRVTREGPEGALRLIRQLRERGCGLVSIKEPWLDADPAVQTLLVSFAGWMAEQESRRRSERIKAGQARRKAAGLPLGRQAGAKDTKPRKKSGYYERWEKERAGR